MAVEAEHAHRGSLQRHLALQLGGTMDGRLQRVVVAVHKQHDVRHADAQLKQHLHHLRPGHCPRLHAVWKVHWHQVALPVRGCLAWLSAIVRHRPQLHLHLHRLTGHRIVLHSLHGEHVHLNLRAGGHLKLLLQRSNLGTTKHVVALALFLLRCGLMLQAVRRHGVHGHTWRHSCITPQGTSCEHHGTCAAGRERTHPCAVGRERAHPCAVGCCALSGVCVVLCACIHLPPTHETVPFAHTRNRMRSPCSKPRSVLESADRPSVTAAKNRASGESPRSLYCSTKAVRRPAASGPDSEMTNFASWSASKPAWCESPCDKQAAG